MSNEQQAWFERWEQGRIGFHLDAVHRDLVQFGDRLLGDRPRRVFVPLCGKTLDLPWLTERGHEVVAVELVDRAVAALHQEQAIPAEVTQEGPFSVYRSPRLTVFCGDFFALEPGLLGPIDCVWDRAALIALSAAARERYVAHLRALVGAELRLLQNTLDYDQSVMEGPPWAVPEQELRRHYAGCDIELLRREDMLDEARRAQGHRYVTGSTFLISSR